MYLQEGLSFFTEALFGRPLNRQVREALLENFESVYMEDWTRTPSDARLKPREKVSLLHSPPVQPDPSLEEQIYHSYMYAPAIPEYREISPLSFSVSPIIAGYALKSIPVLSDEEKKKAIMSISQAGFPPRHTRIS